jgi:membrane dipeptidase
MAALAALLSTASAALPATAQEMSEAEMRAIHDRVFTLDTHVDIGTGYATPALDPGQMTRAQVTLPGMRIGGLDAGFFIVYVGQQETTEAGLADMSAEAEDKYQAIQRMLRAYPDQIGFAATADEAEEIYEGGRLVALIGMENASPLGDSVEDVPMWAERGVRYMSITHFGHNQFGGSSNPRDDLGDAPEDPGLTDLGRELIPALNDAGIMIDISHVGKRTGLEAMELSRSPILASHSTARAVYDNPRGLDDEQLRAIAEDDGVAHITAFRSYLGPVDEGLSEAIAELRTRLGLESGADFRVASPDTLDEYAREQARLRDEFPDVTLDQFIDHVVHAIEVAGIDHVGLSGDFDGGGGVEGWDSAADSVNVSMALMERGYTEEDLAKLWSGNVLRVLRAAEAAAAE